MIKQLSDSLKVIFSVGSTLVDQDPVSMANEENSVDIDLTSIKGTNYLKLILDSNMILYKQKTYEIVSREFLVEGSVLFVILEPKTYEM